MSYYLRGPIITSFYILGIDSESATYILGDTDGTTGTFGFYYFDQNYTSLNARLFQTSTNQLGDNNYITGLTQLSQSTDGSVSLVPINTPQPGFTISSLNVFPTNDMLAGVFYNMFNVDGKRVTFHIRIPSGEQIPAITQIRFVPITWFPLGACSAGFSGNILNQELAWVQGRSTLKGFTLNSQCQNNFFYEYCSVDQTCGGCYGPCASNKNQSLGQPLFTDLKSCVPSEDNKIFYCDNNNHTAPLSIWGSLNFILFLILIFALIILCFSMIYATGYVK